MSKLSAGMLGKEGSKIRHISSTTLKQPIATIIIRFLLKFAVYSARKIGLRGNPD